MNVMPRDLMHVGPRTPGPRAALEFEEVWMCASLDEEEKDEEQETGERPETPTPAYEGDPLPDFSPPHV